MRFYNPGDHIYMFGFSRGAYIARFLAEMLDYIGLLSHGNEEMVRFAWKAFAQWQGRDQASGEGDEAEKTRAKREEMFRFMKGFRETFSRPVGRIRFLGLFDTVNSVPHFETAWMGRSKFPYTARSSAKVIRHAVSIDERRAKFRQDLMYQDLPQRQKKEHRHFGEFLHEMRDGKPERGRHPDHLSPNDKPQKSKSGPKHAPYRARSKSCQRARSGQRGDAETSSNLSGLPLSDVDDFEMDETGQDIDEVWFAGGHADVGGGWEMLEDSKSSSHIPLAWMVKQAQKAGLPFDADKLVEMGCCAGSLLEANDKTIAQQAPEIPALRVMSGSEGPSREPTMPMDEKPEAGHPHGCFDNLMRGASTARIHDSLCYGQGLGSIAVTAWKLMEYLPFRRMDLRPDGSWAPIRWPLPCGEVRDIPDTVRVHGSVIHRMKTDESYRPGNLIIGGGGRGIKIASSEHGIGEWECVDEPGDPVGEVWVKKKRDDRLRD